jgi:hypothetical protein
VLEIKSHQAPAAPRLYAAQAGQGVRP